MNGDVQITVTGGTVPYPVQVAVDRLAATLTPYSGWAIRVDLDPGITLTATPARETDHPGRNASAPVRPTEGPLSPEPASGDHPEGPSPAERPTAP